MRVMREGSTVFWSYDTFEKLLWKSKKLELKILSVLELRDTFKILTGNFFVERWIRPQALNFQKDSRKKGLERGRS